MVYGLASFDSIMFDSYDTKLIYAMVPINTSAAGKETSGISIFVQFSLRAMNERSG